MEEVLYKPLGKLFRNRKERKKYFGRYRADKLWKNNRDDFEIITTKTSRAPYEYVYPNATDLN